MSEFTGRKALMIDNYDSFTFNLVQYLQQLGAEVTTVRNDAATAEDLVSRDCDLIVVSPGPSTPDNAGVCLELIAKAVERKKPLFGVCLGFQCLAQVFGGKIITAQTPTHGKTAAIHHGGLDVFHELPSPLTATRYHSLILDPATLPAELEVTATFDPGDAEPYKELIMGVRHRHAPVSGVQFHPESVLTETGLAMLANALRIAVHNQTP